MSSLKLSAVRRPRGLIGLLVLLVAFSMFLGTIAVIDMHKARTFTTSGNIYAGTQCGWYSGSSYHYWYLTQAAGGRGWMAWDVDAVIGSGKFISAIEVHQYNDGSGPTGYARLHKAATAWSTLGGDSQDSTGYTDPSALGDYMGHWLVGAAGWHTYSSAAFTAYANSTYQSNGNVYLIEDAYATSEMVASTIYNYDGDVPNFSTHHMITYVVVTYAAMPPAHWAPTFTSSPTTTASEGNAYSYTVTTNETSTFSGSTNLSSWLSFGAANHTWYGRAPTGFTPTTYGHQNFTPVSDSTIDTYYSNINYGSSSYLYVGRLTGRYIETYIRWNISLPADAIVTSTSLHLYHFGGTANALQVYPVSSATWDESTIKGNNAPPLSYYPASGYPSPGYESFTDSSSNGWRSISGSVLSAIVEDQLTTGKVSLGIATTTLGYDSYYFSKEGSSSLHPYLQVYWYVPGTSAVGYVHTQATSTAGTLSAWQNYTLTTLANPPVIWAPTFTSSAPTATIDAWWPMSPYTATCNETVSAWGADLVPASLTFTTANHTLWGSPDYSSLGKGRIFISIKAQSNAGTLWGYQNWSIQLIDVPPPPTWAPHATALAQTHVENGTAYSFILHWNETVNSFSWTSNGSGWLTYSSGNSTLWGRTPAGNHSYYVDFQAKSVNGTLVGHYNFTLTVYWHPAPRYFAPPHEPGFVAWLGDNVLGLFSMVCLIGAMLVWPLAIVMYRGDGDPTIFGKALAFFLLLVGIFAATLFMR